MPATEDPPCARNFNRIHGVYSPTANGYFSPSISRIFSITRNRIGSACSGPSSAPSGFWNKENVPCEPRKSGVDIAESSRPLKSSGGKVTGTRRIVLPTPCRSRIFQNGSLLRRISTDGRSSGISNLPIRNTRRAGRTFAEESSGAYVRKSRFKKSKILCFAGFTPVANVDQATGDSAGHVVLSL